MARAARQITSNLCRVSLGVDFPVEELDSDGLTDADNIARLRLRERNRFDHFAARDLERLRQWDCCDGVVIHGSNLSVKRIAVVRLQSAPRRWLGRCRRKIDVGLRFRRFDADT